MEVSESTVTLLKLRLDRAHERRVERSRGNGRVGGDDGDHRGHVRHDHARTLRHAAHRERAAVVADAVARERRPRPPSGCVSVVMMARAASAPPSARERGGSGRHAGAEGIDGKMHADDAGGGDEHLGRGAAHRVAGDPRRLARGLETRARPLRRSRCPSSPPPRAPCRSRTPSRCSRDTVTGAEQNTFWVNTAAHAHGSSATTSARSKRSGSLRKPACTPGSPEPARRRRRRPRTRDAVSARG